jgi:hypothetical protein
VDDGSALPGRRSSVSRVSQQPSSAAVRFTAPVDRLRATARRLDAASRAAHGLCEHPGRVRGLAQDGGDQELRDAAAELARRWHWSLEQLAGGTSRWAALLELAADQYAEVEREVAGTVARLGLLPPPGGPP